MKVPYIESQFKVISIHYCTVFGIEGYSGSEGGRENAFVCICTSVCMCVLSRSSKTLYGTPVEEGVNEKFSILVFRNFGLGAKSVQKMKSICRV